MNKIIIIVVALVLIFTGIYFFQSKNQPITVNTAKITDSSASIKYQIDVSYPQIQGLKNTTEQNQINSLIQNQMNSNVDYFKQEVNASQQQLYQNPNVPQAILNATNTYNITYQTSQASDKIISVYFNISDYQAGAAHPNETNQVFNYDVKNNKQLSLINLFKPGSNYIQALSEIAMQDLISKDQGNEFTRDMIEQGAGANPANFILFNLTPNNLILIFPPYQVGPGASGTQTVTIPLQNLKDILNPEFLPHE